MKKKTIISLSVIFLILAAVAYFFIKKSKKQETEKIDPGFKNYISGFTSGIISKQSTIRIILMDGVTGIENNDELEKGLLKFSPNIEGTAIWVNKRTIQFTPKEKLASGEIYRATFLLGKIKEVPQNLKKFEFDFQIIKQSYTSTVKGIKPYNNKNLKLQALTGSVKTADVVSLKEIEGLLKAEQNNRKLPVKWKMEEIANEYYFQVDSVLRTEEQGSVKLKWDAYAINVKSRSDDNIEIPALGDFKIMNISVTQQPSQYITLTFSDPLDKRQNLDGLIRLENGTSLDFIIENNDIKVYPNVRQLSSSHIIVDAGIKNILGYKLNNIFKSTVVFQSIKPEVKLIGKGNILPNSNGIILPFKAVNLSAVNVRIIKVYEKNVLQFFQNNQFGGREELKRVGRIVFNKVVPLTSDKVIDYGKWNTFSLDLSKLIETEPGAIYRVQLNFTKSQSLYPCEEEEKSADEFEDIAKEEVDLSDIDYWAWNGYDAYDYGGEYSWRDKDDPCKKSYYMRNNRAVSVNVLASDLGIIAKGGNSKKMLFVVNNMITTKPLSGVNIEIFNFQQQKIGETTTDDEGLASVELEKKPYILVAKKGNQFGYLRLDEGSALSLSMFNVGGNQSKKGVKGFIYGERGVWRPGDSLYITFILEDKQKVLPENHPVVFDLVDPRGQIYARKVKSESENGLYDFRTATNPDVFTGNWLARIKTGGSVFEKVLKIETVKPNRLKIELDFGKDILTWGEPESGKLSVKWLHGAIAGNLNADVEMNLSKTKTSFKAYPEFIFDDPAKEFYSDQRMVFDGSIDQNGEADIIAEFNTQSSAPGMLRANFKIRAFEKSGEFSVGSVSIPYSPYSSYVGLKIPEGKGWNGALMSDREHSIPLVTIDEKGNPVNRNNLKIQVYKLRWRWWWERGQDDDVARYIRNTSSTLEFTTNASTQNGEGTFKLKLKNKYWGRMYVKVTDQVSGHSTGKIIYMDYPGWWDQGDNNLPGGATMLTFALDKKSYKVGEDAVLTFPSTQGGRALVSIESGSDVVSTSWVETLQGSTSYKFEVTEKMAPNVYVHVSLLQPHNQVLNDLPIRLYGVQPMMVENPETHLKPVIEMPDVLEPNEEVSIKVSENKGKEMSYTIAIVDDGLLDLTNFRTPDAWNHFYSRDALGVKTWDMYDYVMGAFTGEMAGLLEIGGGDEMGKKGGKKANRFKPVVKFMGLFTLKGGSKTHTFTMPNYVGSVRTMVVAGYEGAYGLAEKTTPVKKPLMVMATLPRVIGPGEEVKLPVTVFAMNDKIKNVNVSVVSNDFLIAQGEESQKIEFTQQGDKVINFNYKAASKLGVATVKVIAESGKEKSVYTIELDVRPANPRITKVISTVIDPGKSWSETYMAVGMEGTNNGVLEVSRIVPLNLEQRLRFLIRYPHGCIEQTTSSVFPQLYLENFMELSKEKKTKIEENVKAGINRLKSFQQADGGMSYWPGTSGHTSDWGTNYAGHFLLEAKAKGYDLPIGWLDAWAKYQRKQARKWSPDDAGSRYHYYNRNDLIQAYRLYTLALADKAALGAMNRMREMKGLSIQAKWRLAAAYHIAGKPEVAEELIENLETQVKKYKEFSYTYGSSERDHAMIIEALALMKKREKAKKLVEDVSKKLGSNYWYSTQTTAYSLMAISKFLGTDGNNTKMEYQYTINDEKEKNAITDIPVNQFKLDMLKNPDGKVSIQNNGKSVLFARIILDGIPLAGDETSSENDLRMTVRYIDTDGYEMNVTKIKQGTDIIAEVTVHHPGIRANYEEMALTQIFPSGWEIRNTRMDNFSVSSGDEAEYQDIRDDRIYTYFDLKQNEKKTFKVQLNAAYLGKFYLPTIYCEAMYDNEVNASKAGYWVEVVEPGK